MIQKYDELLRDLKNKIFLPIYLLEGEESYFIDRITQVFEESVLTPAERDFNQTVLYGKDTTVEQLDDACRRYPMFSNYQVIILKEAQALKKLEDLLPYVEKPLKSTILVLCYKHGKADKRTKFVKTIAANGVVFTSDKLYDDKVPAWITGYLRQKNVKISPDAEELLVEYLGNDLGKIANELDKLLLNVQEGKVIDVDDIERNIGISKEYNVFELNKALGEKNILKANRIADYFASNQKDNPLVVTLGTLYSFFSKLFMFHLVKNSSDKEIASTIGVNPYFLKEYKLAAQKYNQPHTERAIALLQEYDLRSKGVNSGTISEGELLKELVYRILH
jgi:DNA polymerase III subunit delta